MALTPRRRRFVAEYLVDLNATQAARRAGYAPRSARGQGSRLLRHPAVAASIAAAQAARAERTQVTADAVVRELAKVAFGDPRRLFAWGPKGVVLRESSQLSDAEAALVSEVSQRGETRRVKLHCKLTALTALARHLGLFGNGRGVAGRLAAAQDGAAEEADDPRERLARRIAGVAARLGTGPTDR